MPGLPRPRVASFTTTEPALATQQGIARGKGPSPPARIHPQYQEVREQLTPVRTKALARDGQGLGHSNIPAFPTTGDGNGGSGRVTLREVGLVLDD